MCYVRSTDGELPVVYDSSLSVNYIEIGKFTKCDVNQMWILKTSKDLLEYIQSRSLSSCNSIKTFDFSTLYTTIPYSTLKNRLRELVQLCFIKKNGQRRYKDLVLGRDRSDLILKKNTLILPKSSLKLISSTCSSF